MNEGSSLLSQTQLKERGWTLALVKKVLDPPDATKSNPHYKSAAPMRLYTASRVEAAERSEEWKQAKARAAQRSEVGKVVAARKAAALVKEAERLPITVTRIPLETVVTRAIASYEEYQRQIDARYRGVS